ncbi:hypothetical protein H310_06271 [Aphanomyces invadans]|uniref:MATE efflux family protein n=1 Tax=Aphanomyces invadans TaxID=157072 RepID=A0A024U6W8_9STRA|nr:hypothetical protein H310_06271 [Aphanomyces invadans]ETW01642.1 hypothetical protein H310_06271 [Aphanomyces invadans]|eukprot:XP_008869490.1 hypothetical protein H310_06271 [Aphanomyces invadans]
MASHALLGGVQPPPPNVRDETIHLISLAAPMMLNFMMESMYAPISVGLVGHLGKPDTKPFVDGVTMGCIYMMVTTHAVGLGLGSALDTLATQAHGAGNYKKMGVYLESAMLGTALAYIPTAAANWYCQDILTMCGINTVVANLAGQFVRYSTFAMPFYFLYDLIRKMLQAHDIVAPMLPMAIVSNGLHVGLGLYLTQVQKLGYHGVLISGGLSHVAYPLMQLAYLTCINPVHHTWKLQWNLRSAIAHLPEFFEFGLPGMATMLIENGAFGILGFMAGELPHSLLLIAVNSVLLQTITTAFIMYIGFSVATTVRMGNAIGANQLDHARCIMRVSLVVTTLCLALTTGGLFLWRHDVPSLYVNDAQVCDRAATALVFVLPLHASDSFNAVWQAMLQAVGKPSHAAYVNAVAYYIIGLPLAGFLAFSLHWSLEGLWAGLTIGSFCACGAYTVIMARLSWREVLEEANARTADDGDTKMTTSWTAPPLATDGCETPIVLYT